MQQEMFECTLLNFLSVYSLLKFIELPKEQRIFDDKIQPKPIEEEVDEEQENIVSNYIIQEQWWSLF
jgi:hypothetical protein